MESSKQKIILTGESHMLLVDLYRAAFSVAPGAARSRFQYDVHRESTRDLFGSHFGNVPVDEQSLTRVRVSDGHV